jgi:hypothetical protein
MLRKHPATLDTLLSKTWVLVGKRTPALKRDQSRDLLFYLLCRLYDQSPGHLGRAQLVLPQDTLARDLGLSRQWVGVLLGRLRQAGGIEYAGVDGRRGATVFRVGGQVKRLLEGHARSGEKTG